jgi:serine/threonine-protein kinase
MDEPASRSADRANAVLGRTIAGKFLIESYLGGGAMGAVYKARQLALDKDVAVKLMHGEHAGDATFVARFQREAKAASKLDHPNSMRVIDFGVEPDGLLYIAMEYLDGRDLFALIRKEWPLSGARVADIVSQALAAVAVAHDTGIVHRDLKPENIMILRGTDDEGRPRDIVKVCDFGIAKFTDQRDAHPTGGGKLTTQGIVVGTPEYMSPEQGKGESLDARSDLYAMGVILYQLMTGRVPFDAETALGIVLKHVTEDPPPPRTLNPLADERLQAICLKAMKKKREERYQSAREMRAELRAVLGTGGLPAQAATVELAPSSAALAPTALAIDSAQIAAAASKATSSKLTPAGTVAAAEPDEPSRSRTLAVALMALTLGAGAVVLWTMRAGAPPPPPAPEAAGLVVPPAPTTLEPLTDPTAELPPLEPSPHGKPTGTATATASATATATATEAATGTAPATASGGGFDASHAHVDWSVTGAGGGATVGAVQRALSRRAGSWTQCYRSGLERRAERIEGRGTLRITTDEGGNVVGARVSGFDAMPGVKSCIATGSRVKIDGVDTGDAWADVQLLFRPE